MLHRHAMKDDGHSLTSLTEEGLGALLGSSGARKLSLLPRLCWSSRSARPTIASMSCCKDWRVSSLGRSAYLADRAGSQANTRLRQGFDSGTAEQVSPRPRRDRPLHLLHVAMSFLDPVTGRGQPLADFTGDQHAAVVSPGAAERYRQIALAFGDIVRQQVDQQFRNALDKFSGLRKRSNVARHARMLAAIVLERRDVVRIGEEPHVEHQVALGRHPMAVAETGYLHQDIRRPFLPSERPVNSFPQLVHIEFGGVDNGVRQLADWFQLLPFAPNAGTYALRGAQRMRTPRLTEAPNQGGLVSFKEDQPGWHHPPDAFEQARKTFERGALADVHHQRRPPNGRRVLGELGELRDQFDGEVVHRIVAQVFQRLEHGSLARAAQPGDDHQLGFGYNCRLFHRFAAETSVSA